MSKLNWLLIGLGILCLAASGYAADVAFWRFDADGKTDGQTADVIADSAGTNTGAAVNAPVYTNDKPPRGPWSTAPVNPNNTVHGGLVNTLAMDLERDSSQYITVPDSASLDMGSGASFTIEGWVKAETMPDLTSATRLQGNRI